MGLCQQPFAQVSRGAREREHTLIPFLAVMIQKSQRVSLRFSRHRWSGEWEPGLFVCFPPDLPGQIGTRGGGSAT